MAIIEDTNYILVFIVSLISSYLIRFLFKTSRNHVASIRDPPSPRALPIIGHLHLVGSAFPKSFQTLARRHGPLMKLRIGSSSFVVASNAKAAKEILRTKDLYFASRFENGPSQFNIYRGTGFITGPYSEYWRFMKKLCVTKLFSEAQLCRFNNIREEELKSLLTSLGQFSREGKHCDVTMEFENLANNLMCRMIMSRRFSKDNCFEAKNMRRLTMEIMDEGAKLGASEVFGILKNFDLFGNGKKLVESMRRFDKVVEEIMMDYEENLSNCFENDGEKDVMDILLETYRDADAEMKLTKIQIKHFIMELLMASIDNSSAAIQWAMAELLNHPEAFKKVREEIDFVVGSKRLIKESDLPNLPYLQAVVKESLRLHTPVPIIHRECTQDCKVIGFDIKAKTKVLVNAYAVMRDPHTWHDQDEFIPERFLVIATDEFGQHRMRLKSEDRDFGYLPFGGGRRKCLGATHAYIVMDVTIGVLIQCFDWKIKDGDKVDISVGSGYHGALASPLLCYPISRFHPAGYLRIVD